jgi:hypothetical protein
MELHLPAISRAVFVFGETVNSRGLSREDYEIALVTHLWEYSRGDFVDHELVATILRNKVRDYQRKNKDKQLPLGVPPDNVSDDLEQHAMNRELIRLLRVALPSDDWDLLVSYIENDCNSRQTWLTRKPCTTSREFFHHKLRELLLYCREVIQSLCNYRSGERVIN